MRKEAGKSGVVEMVREALRGDAHRDFTAVSIGRAITLLAIPMVLEMAMESLFAVVDMFWVAHVGADAVATVGLTEAVETLLYAVAMGLGAATTAMVARRTGEHDGEGAAEAAGQSMVLGTMVALGATALGVWFAPDVLRLMGAAGTLVETGVGYTRAIYGASVSVMLLFVINAAFRGAGDAALAMRVLWMGNLVNLVLNPLLIFGIGPFPRMGVVGSGVGTGIGRTTAVAMQVWMLARGSSRVRVAGRHLRVRVGEMVKLARMSLGGMFQYVVGMAAWIVLVRMVATFGSVAVAGYTVAMRIFIFAILPSWGLANAAATLVGQNLGAGKPERAEQSAWRAGLYNMIFLGLVAVVFVTMARPLVSVFTADAGVVDVAARALRVISYGYIFYAWGMVTMQAFNGAGDTWTPTAISLGTNWALQMPLAWALAFPLAWGTGGVFWAVAIAAAVYAGVAVYVFRRGRWKGVVV